MVGETAYDREMDEWPMIFGAFIALSFRLRVSSDPSELDLTTKNESNQTNRPLEISLKMKDILPRAIGWPKDMTSFRTFAW